ncbi:MAG TPA: hypothetical protein VIJ75_09365 [Hanamia sp.]
MKQIDISDCLIGRFYFKKTYNGNLIGEFSNNRINIISSESADAYIENKSDDFIGIYNTTWQQEGVPFFAKLTISYRDNTHRIYKLEWERNRETIFIGEGFVFENNLIGDYRDFEII